jgi:hypothetical protein
MSFLRRPGSSLITSIRQITSTNITQAQRDNAVRGTVINVGKQILQQNSVKDKIEKNSVGGSVVSIVQNMKQTNYSSYLPNSQSAFSMPSGAKFVFSSQSSRVTRMFASFDLSACSISFVGMMGDFAVWAIMDLSTGELMYLIDDNGGSEIYIEIYSYYNVGSITKHS